jgi:hypothetical protein
MYRTGLEPLNVSAVMCAGLSHASGEFEITVLLIRKKKERKKDSLFSQQQRYIHNVNDIPCYTTDK